MRKGKTPTFAELMKAYPKIAEIERMKSERPCITTVWNVLSGVKHILMATGVSDELPITALTRQKLDLYLAGAKERGQTITTAWTYVLHLRGIVARWTLPYYEGEGWKVEPFSLPICRRRAPRYVRPDREMLARVKEWYDSLLVREDKRDWVVVTLMLEFGMRNGDIGRLRWSDFRVNNDELRMKTDDDGTRHEAQGTVVLFYTPRKTSLSSGRVIAWPVHAEIWRQLVKVRAMTGDREGTHFQGLVVPAAKEVFPRLNREIRERHFFANTHKALYELRKVCVDHIYQRFGAEAASSISGDDIKTVTRYYADPSRPNIGAVRVIDLL